MGCACGDQYEVLESYQGESDTSAKNNHAKSNRPLEKSSDN